ncbi:MAG: hypothetical protein V4581_02945 [Bacteroidota bacterium]
MKTKLIAILLVFCLHAAAQQHDTLQGHIVVAGAGAPGVFVINKNTGTEVKTNNKGLFKITAKNGDRLTVYSNKTVVREFYIDANAFKNPPYAMEVEPQGYEVEEVFVDHTITAQSLGIVPKGQKQNTVARRRLYTAAGNRPLWVYALGLLAGSMPLDPFINAITGRTKMLKKELATEQREVVFQKIEGVYTHDELTTRLGIPADKADGFLYFAAEDATLNSILSESDERIRLELAVVANKYLILQQETTVVNQTPAPNVTDED